MADPNHQKRGENQNFCFQNSTKTQTSILEFAIDYNYLTTIICEEKL